MILRSTSPSHTEGSIPKGLQVAWDPKNFALRTGKPEKTITAILKGDSSITSDMAVRKCYQNTYKLLDEPPKGLR